MNSFIKRQLLRARIYIIFDAKKRSNYIVKKNIFYSVGKNLHFQPRKIPSEPKLIKFGDNVVVGSGTTFITHDFVHEVLNQMNIGWYNYYAAPIEVGNNVFIGGNSTILPNVKIGSNVIIGAGSIVTKDVSDGKVVAGNPAKVIGTFDEYLEKRKKINDNLINSEDLEKMWNKFNEEKENN